MKWKDISLKIINVNRAVPKRTEQKYYETNKENIRKRQKQYREPNKENSSEYQAEAPAVCKEM